MAIKTIPFLTCDLLIRLSANDTLCPASPLVTDARFRWIVLTAVGMNWPTESGPRRTWSLAGAPEFKRFESSKSDLKRA